MLGAKGTVVVPTLVIYSLVDDAINYRRVLTGMG